MDSHSQRCCLNGFDMDFSEEVPSSSSAAAFEASEGLDSFAVSAFLGDYYCESADDVTRSVAVDPGMELDFGPLFQCAPQDASLLPAAKEAVSPLRQDVVATSAAPFSDDLPLPKQHTAAALAATSLELRPGASAAALLNHLRARLATNSHAEILKERPQKFRLKAEVLVATGAGISGSGFGGVGPILGCTVSVRAFDVKDETRQFTMVEFRRCAGDGVAFGHFFQDAIGHLRQTHPEAAVWPASPSTSAIVGCGDASSMGAHEAAVGAEEAAIEAAEIASDGVQQPLVDMLAQTRFEHLREEAVASLVFLCSGGRGASIDKMPHSRARGAVQVLAAAAKILAASSPVPLCFDTSASRLAAKVLSQSLKVVAEKIECAVDDDALMPEALGLLRRMEVAA
eukprot:TRINITY_DN25949_c0_g1_i1.p1 TRINITY_DN25949_c0_g1~~TRINITY_DN25949_c0_g1_i1.p1  ORF type:complete len:419 (+),score=110.74 TRINITY_DN25949_c0_g1_i1:61-1257(+)